jgi:hypothetical protein
MSHHVETLTPCRYINRRGHHCRLFSSVPNLELCPHHARQQLKQKQRLNDASAAELLGDLTDFSTPDTVNILLGNLVRQLARKRIARRDAMAIAYVSQLLLTSHAALDRQNARDQAEALDGDLSRFFSQSALPPDSTPDSTSDSIADSINLATPFNTTANATTQNEEGRA